MDQINWRMGEGCDDHQSIKEEAFVPVDAPLCSLIKEQSEFVCSFIAGETELSSMNILFRISDF